MSKQTNQYNNYSDEALMKLFQGSGNRAAFEEVYRRYFQTLCKYITWVSGSSIQAEDIAQNILVKLFNKPTIFNSDKNLKVWLFVAVKNQIINEKRNASTRSSHLEIVGLNTKSSTFIDQSSDTTRLKAVQAALHNLSKGHQEVITLKYSSNLTIKEISEVLGCSEGTIKSRLFYAIKHMRLSISKSKMHENE